MKILVAEQSRLGKVYNNTLQEWEWLYDDSGYTRDYAYEFWNEDST